MIPSHKSPVSRAAVARPPNGGDADPEGRSVRGEKRTSSPATTEGESHIKASPSTSEVARPSEVGRGRLLLKPSGSRANNCLSREWPRVPGRTTGATSRDWRGNGIAEAVLGHSCLEPTRTNGYENSRQRQRYSLHTGRWWITTLDVGCGRRLTP